MKRALLLFMLLVALGTDAQAGQISGHVTDAEPDCLCPAPSFPFLIPPSAP
jgi:hypothetical protein